MVKFVNNSRIDGYPILKLSKDEDGQSFVDYVKNNFSDDTIQLITMYDYGDPNNKQYLDQLDQQFDYFFVKIVLNNKEYTAMFETFKNIEQRKNRKEKIERINLNGR